MWEVASELAVAILPPVDRAVSLLCELVFSDLGHGTLNPPGGQKKSAR